MPRRGVVTDAPVEVSLELLLIAKLIREYVIASRAGFARGNRTERLFHKEASHFHLLRRLDIRTWGESPHFQVGHLEDFSLGHVIDKAWIAKGSTGTGGPTEQVVVCRPRTREGKENK